MTKDVVVDVQNEQQENRAGVWRNARQTLKRAKQEARRYLTLRWPPQKRHHSKANVPSVPLEWQQPEGVASHSANSNSGTSAQPSKQGQLVTHEQVTAPLAKPETADFVQKPASVVYSAEFEQAGNVRVYGASPKFTHHHRFTYADDEDPGIMSESETSATGSRRNGRSKYAQQNGVAQNHGFVNASAFNVQLNGIEKSLGLVFLHYQGETKRALLPDELRSLDDIRKLFVKAFPTVLNFDYMKESHVKIYIQDPARQDVFYELDDLSEVKDRTVLKLHEQMRPMSPIPLSASGTPLNACSGAIYDTTDNAMVNFAHQTYQQQQQAGQTVGQQQSSIPTLSSNVNLKSYGNDEDYDRSSYRIQKCASTTYVHAGGGSVGYDRRYGTLDSVPRNGAGERVRYSSAEPPSKPQRFAASPLSHHHALNGGRCSGSPPSCAVPPPPPVRAKYSATGSSDAKLEAAYAATRGYATYSSTSADVGGNGHVYNNGGSTNSGSSDRSGSVSRCGSVTPVIDEEARVRMVNMEKQLASLSSLVHSALMAKGVSETVYKDIEMLRREILGPVRDDVSDSGSVSRFSDLSSDKGSFSVHERDSQLNRNAHGKSNNSPPSSREFYPTSFMGGSDFENNHLSPEAKCQLKHMKKRVTEVQVEVKQLRRSVQLNAQTTNDVLKDVFDRIKVILNTNKHLHLFAAQARQQNLVETSPLLSDRSWVNQEEERYRNLMRKVEQELGEFEKHIEDLRQRVINGERKLRLSEVEAFTESLTHIGRTAANLKTQFPSLQQRLKHVMGAEMEKVVKEEKFLKDEPHRLDSALQRCKKLTSTMLTMKKLALVQDRSAYHNSMERERPSSATPQSAQNLAPPPKPAKPASVSAEAPPLPPPPKNYRQNDNVADSPLINGIDDNINKSRKPQQQQHPHNQQQQQQASNGKPNGEASHVLDTLLEELQTVAAVKNGSEKSNGNGGNYNNNEKRVAFVDQVQNFPTDDETASNGGTIKRSPKGSSGVRSSLTNNNGNGGGPLNGIFDDIINDGGVGGHLSRAYSSPQSRNSVTPSPVAGRSGVNVGAARPHSTTPLSEIGFSAPPPPPRSSSRGAMTTNGPSSPATPPVRSSYSGSDIEELKKQLVSDINCVVASRGDGRTSGSQTPTAMIQTNAVDVDMGQQNSAVRSASSSDSVNSQDLRPVSPYANKSNSNGGNYNHHQHALNKPQLMNGKKENVSARDLFFQNGDIKQHQLPDRLMNGSQWI